MMAVESVEPPAIHGGIPAIRGVTPTGPAVVVVRVALLQKQTSWVWQKNPLVPGLLHLLRACWR